MRPAKTNTICACALASMLALGCERKNDEASDGEAAKPVAEGTEPKSVPPGEPVAHQLSHQSQEFVMAAARHGIFQIELGQVAQQHAQIPAVKEFAGKLVEAHRKANEELRTLVEHQNVSFPTGLTDDGQDTKKELMEEEANDFDEEYMSAVIDRYQKAIDEYDQQSKRDEAPQLQHWASTRLPALHDDLEQAKRIKEQNVDPEQSLLD
ncbi:DUF4142 domain-containing protein [Paraliomyxa miuraensis]|uniref:DUF4142 domain-containing protein n=1 Tax=Paraliomyxa miuraensis TaxID=376150 RepID=UPI00225A1877|nr:DUF4142 domain-containing protein [Paraliomyxa miuraensis]MCX4245474.1 DUF4142 domain-containing protein [Paraliomyxa miuraensis]